MVKITQLKKIAVALLALLSIGANLKATNVKASTFGWTATDATTAFQNAVKSNYDTIIVDLQNSDWIVGPSIFFDLNNKTIIFENKVVLRAKADVYSKYASLLEFVRGKNIVITGYGAIFKMNKAEYAALSEPSEFRHCLSMSNCTNIKVYGLKLIESGGDGVLIYGSTNAGSQNYCENIILKDLWCDNNYRQGIHSKSTQHDKIKTDYLSINNYRDFFFGFLTWINGIVIPYFQICLELSNFQATLVVFATYIAYFVMALPSAWVLSLTGYKKGMVLGLFIMALGTFLFLPAAYSYTYSIFLTGLFITGTGVTLLQTAANPYVAIIGPIESTAQTLSSYRTKNKTICFGQNVVHSGRGIINIGDEIQLSKKYEK